MTLPGFRSVHRSLRVQIPAKARCISCKQEWPSHIDTIDMVLIHVRETGHIVQTIEEIVAVYRREE